MGEDAAGPPSRQRVSVDEAARALGLTVDAVRKRVQRGTIEHEKDQGGRVRILLDSPDNTSTIQDERRDATGPAKLEAVLEAKDETIEDLRDRVRSLERQLEQADDRDRENRRVIIALTSRIPALEAPREPSGATEPPGAPETAAEASEGAGPRSATGEAQEATQRPQAPRSLWARIFGR
ncbi:MAG: DUF3972 domain-containing protein [Actinomycetota bacterium]|nr:DUF3972 domain-containing protein [Actinomycetota bacterium]